MVRMCLVWPDNRSVLTATHLHVGRVIHEFDPWFNYRATEYMAANGYDAFQVRARRARRTPRHGK